MIKTTTKPDLIVYGGSFDPPHLGHLDCAKVALTLYPASQLWIIPSFKPPSSAGVLKPLASSYDDRIAMVEINFSEIRNSNRVEISTIESMLEAPSYTLNTLEAIARTTQFRRISLLIGSDQLLNFINWYGAAQIAKRYGLIIIPRGIDSTLSSCQTQLKIAMDSLGVLIEPSGELGGFCVEGSQAEIRVHHQSLIDAASSEIRKGFTEVCEQHPFNATVPSRIKNWLKPEVVNYIKLHGLYVD